MSSASPGPSKQEEENKQKDKQKTETTHTKETVKISSTDNYRTSSYNKSRQLCKYFISKGSCPYGEKCRYRHPPRSTPTHQQVCQYYLSSNCRYGNRCKFLHEKRDEELTEELTPPTSSSFSSSSPSLSLDAHLLNVTSFPSLSSSLLSKRQAPPTQATPLSINTPVSNPSTAHPTNYKRGYERRGEEPLTLEDFIKKASNVKTRPAVSRPKPTAQISRTKTHQDEKGEGLSSLRDIEIEQLRKRYHDNKLLEKSSDNIIYSINFSPTDPDWVRNKLPSFEIKVSLPSDYPKQVCTLLVTEGLPSECIELINESLKRRLEEQYTKSTASGQYELMLRPVLNWLDNHVMSLIEGTSFVEEYRSKYDKKSEEEENSEDDQQEEDSISPLKGFQSPIKRGTEIRLVDMQFSESIGTVHVNAVKITVECMRCKSHCDLLCKGNKTSSQVCIRCNQTMAMTFNPDLLHTANPSLAYLDLSNCRPVDVVLSSCEGHMTCVECGKDQLLKGWSFGQALMSSCHYCHISLFISASQCRFITHQPGQVVFTNHTQEVITKKKKKPDFIEGKPLPDTGTCHHYKKSHRWLRFPCCGKVYPCDTCHDSAEDHPMERANRMICGYCAKEQVYNSTKPCSGCSSDMTQSRPSSHWEGGQGCRNKVKMCRNDRQKYSNSDGKTVSMKLERVGVKGKNNQKL